jgi:transposase
MEPIIEKCAGLDVHKETVVACVLLGAPEKRPRKDIRTFRTLHRDLEQLRGWLTELGVSHVAMESTGIYWVPVFRVLEGAFELIVGNAHHIKNVPGRKTDIKDSEWIADLLRHGLIRPSFVPPPPIRELRVLTRYRKTLIDDQARTRNRIGKLLETANIKLASVASDIFGASGQAMLAALVDGIVDAAVLAALAKGSLRKKIPALTEALDGRFDPEHGFVLKLHLDQLRATDRILADLDARITEKLAPYAAQVAALIRLPGIDRVHAASIIAELGVDMSVFPSVRHCAAWAGMTPGNNESGGIRRPANARRGNVHLKTTLVQAAAAASKKKGSYYREKFWRLKARRGPRRALVAIGHKLLIAIYYVLSGQTFVDLGPAFLHRQASPSAKRHHVQQLQALGYHVILEKLPT